MNDFQNNENGNNPYDNNSNPYNNQYGNQNSNQNPQGPNNYNPNQGYNQPNAGGYNQNAYNQPNQGPQQGPQQGKNYSYTVNINTGARPIPQSGYAAKDSGLALAAFILNLISTVGVGWLLIPLAWMIPMTVRSYGIYKGTKPNTVAYAVCDIIFLNIVSGILLLVAPRDE